MKKVVSLILALTMLFVLCACSPNIEDLVVKANHAVLVYPYDDIFCVEGQYDSEYNCYFVLIYVNDDVLDGTKMSKNSLEGKAAMALLANSTESDEIMKYMFDKVSDIFKRTDVDVIVGFLHVNGEITKKLSTIE